MSYKEIGFSFKFYFKKFGKMLNNWSICVSKNSWKDKIDYKHLWWWIAIYSPVRKFKFELERKKQFLPSWFPLTPLSYCTWMLLTELCLFAPIRFSTVHAQVSVNINYFYQGLQCAELLAKRVYCRRQMKMRESKVTWMLHF